MDRPKLNLEKIQQLPTVNDYLDEKYGKEGTPTREAFRKEAYAYYYGEILRQKRKEKGMTQQELADRIGKKRTYISKVERGETDLQLSSFAQILNGLGLSLEFV